MDPALYTALAQAVRNGRPAALATVVTAGDDGPPVGRSLLVIGGADGTERLGGLGGDPNLDEVVARDAAGEMAGGVSGVRHYGRAGEARLEQVTVFIDTYAPPPRMLVFGAVDFTGALVRVAKVLGYRVTVCDAREVFATRRRFPQADEVVVDWPHRLLEREGPGLGPADAVCVLTHDAKFDVPALLAAVRTGAGYIGAMGSRRTTDERRQRLGDAGMTAEQIDRIMAPIGLDIGARTPEETAVAICAEIVAVRTGRGSGSLRDTAGPLHDAMRAVERTQ